MRIHPLYRDFVEAWRKEPTWESLRNGYVHPHERFLAAYWLNWVDGRPAAPAVVEAEYQRAWAPRAEELVTRLERLSVIERIEAACRAPETFYKPRNEVQLYAFVGLETTSAVQMLVEGRPAIALALEAWGDDFLGLNMNWGLLPIFMAHEYTHVIRYTESDCGLARSFAEGGFDYPRALQTQPLLEFLVDEGLGTYLSAVISGVDPTGALFFSAEDLDWCRRHEAQLWAEAEAGLMEPPGFEGYKRWFSIGREGRPGRVGYLLGYQLVSRYLAEHPEISPREAVNLPAELFWQR